MRESRLLDHVTRETEESAVVIVPPGEDLGAVRTPPGPVLLGVDQVVDGVHFDGSRTSPRDIGWKGVARCVSDVAAMAGRPWAAVVTVVMPAEREVAYVKGLYRGLEGMARKWGVSVVGGETSSGRQAMVSVAMIGKAGTPLAVGLGPRSLALWPRACHRQGPTPPRLRTNRR